MKKKVKAENDLKETLGKKIKEYRNKAGATQEDLQKILNCANSYISRMENGKLVPSVEKLIMICNAIDASMNDVFEYNDVKVEWKNNEKYSFLNRYPTKIIYETLKMMLPMKEAYSIQREEESVKIQLQGCEMAEELSYMSVGKTIEQQRKKIGKTMKKISDSAGIDERTYRKIERSQAVVSPSVYKKIGDAINISLDRMFSGAIKNKDVIIQEYLGEIFDDVDEREEMIFKEIFQAIGTILMAHE